MRCLVGLVVLAGCYGGIDQDHLGGAGSSEVPDAAQPDGHMMDALDKTMLDRAATNRGFARINRAPYASTLGAFDIDVSINQDARDYRKIHPETSGSNVVMPVGTVIVREVLDANGAVTKITLMGKGPPGYDATLGDWWFGVTDPSGVPLPATNGGVQVGRLTECHGCHLPRATDDYLFGVPRVDQ